MFALPPDSFDDAEPMAERHLRMLAELAELGMEIARAVACKAAESDADPVPAFTAISRAVRQTVALEARLVRARQREARADLAQADRLQARQERKARAAQAGLEERRQRQVSHAMGQLIEASVDPDDDGAEDLLSDLNERLQTEIETSEDFADSLSRPVSETIARLCKALDLEPDWPLWADRLWAQAEARDAVAGSPYAPKAPDPPPPAPVPTKAALMREEAAAFRETIAALKAWEKIEPPD